MKHKFLILLIVLLSGLLQELGATTIVADTIGPGDLYSTIGGYALGAGAVNANAGQSVAMSFLMSGTGNFAGFDVATALLFGENSLLVSLYDDASGVPGSVLESFVINGEMGPYLTYNPLISATSVTTPLLSDGSTYWLVLAVPDLINDYAVWNGNSNALYGDVAVRIGTGAWTPATDSWQAAFRIYSTPIPEPSTVGLVALGFLAILVRQRVKRRSVRSL